MVTKLFGIKTRHFRIFNYLFTLQTVTLFGKSSTKCSWSSLKNLKNGNVQDYLSDQNVKAGARKLKAAYAKAKKEKDTTDYSFDWSDGSTKR